MRSLLLIESLDLRPSNQYIFLSESPSCLRLEEMCSQVVVSQFDVKKFETVMCLLTN
jgi:hypothetical protein